MMKVIIDACIWSLALRRKKVKDELHINTLENLIRDFKVQMLGVIRQEILSGIKSESQFKKLKTLLSAFPDYQTCTEDYEQAAAIFNLMRTKGIQGSNTDYLICAIALRNKMSIYTTDKDFFHYAEHIKIKLFDY